MEDASMQQLDKLLKTWSQTICDQTKEIINNAIGKNNENGNPASNSQTIIDDIKDRQSRVITTIQEAHSRQLELLKTAIGEERREFAKAQLIFEQSLRTKYDHSIEALRESIQSELEARMARTLKSLENQAKLEADRVKQAHEFEYEIENRLTIRLKDILKDLRKSWEEEEILRSRHLEEKMKNNYNIVLEHLEAQLKLSLVMQEDADRLWLEDLDTRNSKQLETIKLFEEKCRNLYETRLIEYAEKTNAQILHYEEQLLELGAILAAEKNQFESRLRRVKLSCSRWKLNYQQEIHLRYRDMTGTLEDRYANEITKLLGEIQEMKTSLLESQKVIELKQVEVMKAHEMYAHGAPQISTKQLRSELHAKWEELKLSPSERVDYLATLLDSAMATPELLALYESMSTKLAARVPIAQLNNRKQFLEYKIRLASRVGVATDATTAAEKADLITELTDVKANLEKLIRHYEKSFGEAINITNATAATGSTPLGMGGMMNSPMPTAADTTPAGSSGAAAASAPGTGVSGSSGTGMVNAAAKKLVFARNSGTNAVNNNHK